MNTVSPEKATPRPMDALKPCPFCGSTDIGPPHNISAPLESVSCDNCGATAFEDPETNTSAYDAWNRRAALPAPAGAVEARPTGDATCPVPVEECRFAVGQPVHILCHPAEWNPDAIFYVTGIRWEHRMVHARGWDITIASREDIEKGYGQTDGFSPSDLRASAPASPAIQAVTWGEAREVVQNLLDCPDIADNDYKDEETHAAERRARSFLCAALHPAHSSSPAIGVQAVKALEALINDVQEWVDAVGRGTSWDYWDHHYKHLAYGGLDKYRAALESALHPAPKAASAGGVGEIERATRYAENLAIALHNKHYATDAPNWRPLSGDLAGLLTQIDNMTTGMTRTPSDTAPSPKGVSDGVREALRDIVDFCDDPDGSEKPESLACGLARLLPAARAALSQEHAPGRKESRS